MAPETIPVMRPSADTTFSKWTSAYHNKYIHLCSLSWSCSHGDYYYAHTSRNSHTEFRPDWMPRRWWPWSWINFSSLVSGLPIRGFDCGYMAYAAKASLIVATGLVFFVTFLVS